MEGVLRKLFKPMYGEHFEVRPRHWWSPKDRKMARLAAKLADYQAPGVRQATKELAVEHIVTGNPVSQADIEAAARRSLDF